MEDEEITSLLSLEPTYETSFTAEELEKMKSEFERLGLGVYKKTQIVNLYTRVIEDLSKKYYFHEKTAYDNYQKSFKERIERIDDSNKKMQQILNGDYDAS